MHVCVYLHMYVCIYASVRRCIYVGRCRSRCCLAGRVFCAYVKVGADVLACTYALSYIRMHVFAYLHVYVWMYLCIDVSL